MLVHPVYRNVPIEMFMVILAVRVFVISPGGIIRLVVGVSALTDMVYTNTCIFIVEINSP